MIELFMGIIFLGMSAFATFACFGEGDFGILLFLIPFWAAGGWLFYTGAKKIVTNSKTKQFGTDTYGLVVDFSETGTYVNGYPVWYAHVLVFTDGRYVKTFKEDVGTSPKFDVGDFVRVKHYKDDINVEERESVYSIPSHIREMLEQAAPVEILKYDAAPVQQRDFAVTEDSVIVDGVFYPRNK